MWFHETLYSDIKISLKGTLLYNKKTPYQNLQIYDTARFGKMLTLDGAIQTTEKDEFIYHEMLTHPVLLLHPHPRKILIIGGGDGGALREVLKHPVEKVYLVEIDRDVIDISRKYLKKICRNSLKDKRLTLIIDDGSSFIRNTREKFDIVIIDSPDPIGPARILFSNKFYSRTYAVLKEKGIMIRQSGTLSLEAAELKINYQRLRKIFPFVSLEVAAIPTYIGGFFTFIIASKKINPQKPSIKNIDKKFKILRLNTKYYNPRIHQGSLCLPEYLNKALL